MKEKIQATNPVKAIRRKCLDCSGDSTEEVRNCVIEDCALYPFRMGRNPFRTKRELSPERKAQMAERLAKMREKKAAKSADEKEDKPEAEGADGRE